MITELISVKTEKSNEFVNITASVELFLRKHTLHNGICMIFVPHTTCGITINENSDPDVKRDILMELKKIVPLSDGYHHAEGNSAAHIKASTMGSSVSVPVIDGHLAAGIWQGIYLCEFDGPRNRSVRINFISG